MFYNFRNDLASGKKYESRAQKILEKDYGKLTICNTSDYDLKNKNVSFEVKADFISKNTGNIGIEFRNKGEWSGISVTKADYYFIIGFDRSWSVIVDGIRQDGWWIGMLIETHVLKSLCKIPYYSRKNGGDKKSAVMILIPLEDVREHCATVYPITHGVLT